MRGLSWHRRYRTFHYIEITLLDVFLKKEIFYQTSQVILRQPLVSKEIKYKKKVEITFNKAELCKAARSHSVPQLKRTLKAIGLKKNPILLKAFAT